MCGGYQLVTPVGGVGVIYPTTFIVHSVHEEGFSYQGSLGWVVCLSWPIGLGDGSHVLGNGPHVFGNKPHVLGNGPHLC